MTTKTAVYELLHSTGPSRASKVAELLISTFKLNSDNARQVISRSVGKGEVARFPVKLLPNNEAFLYLKSQRNTDDFWINFLAALREAKSVYAMAIDSLVAKKGIISAEHFPIIAGAPFFLSVGVAHPPKNSHGKLQYSPLYFICHVKLCWCEDTYQ